MAHTCAVRTTEPDYADRIWVGLNWCTAFAALFGIIRNSALCQLCRCRHKTQWTRHKSRLNRDLGRKRWGDEGSAAEELAAELGSAFLCADLDLTPEVRDDHAAYIGSWLSKWRARHFNK